MVRKSCTNTEAYLPPQNDWTKSYQYGRRASSSCLKHSKWILTYTGMFAEDVCVAILTIECFTTMGHGTQRN